MATVYVVLTYDYDSSDVVGVYTSKETADHVEATAGDCFVVAIDMDVVPPLPPDPPPPLTAEEVAARAEQARRDLDARIAAHRLREAAPLRAVWIGNAQVFLPAAH